MASRKWILIIVSALFFAPFGWRSALVFAVSITGNYAVYRWSVRDESEGTGTVTHFGVILNIAVLAFYKYAGALAPDAFGSIVMPVALSFTTFTQIAFLADRPVPFVSFSDYLLHILFFPKVLQGPIQRFEETKEMVIDRLENGVRAEGLLNGLTLFTKGLAKKVLLADTLGRAVAFGYEATPDITRPDVLLTIFLYVLQLYLDFSGYCDMGMGIAQMMSLDLVQNFNMPLKAKSVSDYWARWHLSLTSFFRRYLYIPLGGNRKGKVGMCRNIMIVFLVSGLWHGTGWGFLIWGALHGVVMCIERIIGDKGDRSECHRGEQVTLGPVPFVTCLQQIVTYLFVSLTYVFFRAPSMGQAVALFCQPFRTVVNYVSPGMAGAFHMDEIWYAVKMLHLDAWKYGQYVCMGVVLAVSVAVVVCERSAGAGDKRDGSKCHPGEKVTFRTVPFVTHVCTGVLLAWCIISLSEVQTFLYVNF